MMKPQLTGCEEDDHSHHLRKNSRDHYIGATNQMYGSSTHHNYVEQEMEEPEKKQYMEQQWKPLSNNYGGGQVRKASPALPNDVIQDDNFNQDEVDCPWPSKPQQHQQKEDLSYLSKPMSEMTPIERLKYSQHMYRMKWKTQTGGGISTEYTGRPGTSSLCNKQRQFQRSQKQYNEELRAVLLHKVLALLSGVENELPLLMDSNNSTLDQQRHRQSQYNFYNPKNKQGGASSTMSPTSLQQIDTRYVMQWYRRQIEQLDFVKFRPIEMHELLHDLPPTQTFSQIRPSSGNNDLQYKILRGDTKLVRSLLEANGCQYTDSHDWNILWSSSSCKTLLYEGLNEYQRINHFPSSFEITRKDRLCYNIGKMQDKFGRAGVYDIVPDTYILPNQLREFQAHYEMLREKEPKKNIWIVKPANLSRGRGIHLLDNIHELQYDDLSVISRYITNPLLINGHKFDLRVYVLISSYEPLRVYVYKEGLARFASETYSQKIDNKFTHLTNYSINKKNGNFVQNQNQEQDDVGFKWSLSAFCSHLAHVGIDMDLLWARIYDLILKSIIAGEHYVLAASKKAGLHRNNCFEVFGYDILIDSELKPWLLEVNLSPSLACESPLDTTIKANLIADTFTLIGVKPFDRRKESLLKLKNRAKINAGKMNNTAGSTGGDPLYLTPQSQVATQVSSYIDSLLQQADGELSVDFAHPKPHLKTCPDVNDVVKQAALLKHREILQETVAEYNRRGNYVRIYPAKGSNKYDQYFQGSRPFNKAIYKLLYSEKNAVIPFIGAQETKQEKNMIPKAPQFSQTQKISSNNHCFSSFHNPPAIINKKGIEQETTLEAVTSKQPISQVSTEASTTHGSKLTVFSKQQQRPSTSNIYHSSHNVKSRLSAFSESADLKAEQMYRKQPSNPAFTPVEPIIVRNEDQKVPDRIQDNSQQYLSTNNFPNRSQQQNHPTNTSRDQQTPSKIVITGDDILIEYVSRIVSLLRSQVQESRISDWAKEAVSKFVQHHVWQKQTEVHSPLWQQMDIRMQEMLDRRRRLIKYTLKKERESTVGIDEQWVKDTNYFDAAYEDLIGKKNSVVTRFSGQQLEDLLTSSTKNVAHEVVSCMIHKPGESGLLIQIEKDIKDQQRPPQLVDNNFIEKDQYTRPKSPMIVHSSQPMTVQNSSQKHSRFNNYSREPFTAKASNNMDMGQWSNPTSNRQLPPNSLIQSSQTTTRSMSKGNQPIITNIKQQASQNMTISHNGSRKHLLSATGSNFNHNLMGSSLHEIGNRTLNGTMTSNASNLSSIRERSQNCKSFKQR